MAQEVKIGIVGAGLMGREIAAAIQRWPALINHPVMPIVTAVCDINPAAMDWFDQIPTLKVKTTDYKELLASNDVDVMYIAVRHDLHEQLYVDTINAGKSLFAEKPFGIDESAAQNIMKAINAHPESFVRCSSEMPFFPGAQAAINYANSGALGRIIEVTSSFLHSSDLNTTKPINWKRQAKYCGEAGVLNDLGLHAWHVPLRMGWKPTSVYAELQNIVTTRPGADGKPEACDTWDNATLHTKVKLNDYEFPMTVNTKRIDPGQKNTWELHIKGMDGSVSFTTKNPKEIKFFQNNKLPGTGDEQTWVSADTGAQSVWPTVTGPIFEFGFSDSILQMWAVYLAERAGALGDKFGAAKPEEVAYTHTIFKAALESHAKKQVITL